MRWSLLYVTKYDISAMLASSRTPQAKEDKCDNLEKYIDKNDQLGWL